MDNINLQVIRESFGRVVYSHKVHEKEAEIQNGYSAKVKWINIVLITLTSGGLLGSLITNEKAYLMVSAIFAAMELAFTIYQFSFDPEENTQKHKQIACLLWPIREKYVNLIADITNETIAASEIIRQRDHLLQELDLIYKLAPSTSPDAYKMARRALKLNEELTFSSEEINKFLPTKLHITS